MPKVDALATYKAKRNFAITPEPAAEARETSPSGLREFVVQKHWASRLHYDFRLELNGTMLSWAVPKGPSFDPADKRMAVRTEDHPISYNRFEGTIPEKQYGAGKVIVWDKGAWLPLVDPAQGLREGNLKFELRGHKLHGAWVLVRIKSRENERHQPWLLIKERDGHARPAAEFSVVDEMPDSVHALPMPQSAAPSPQAGESGAGKGKARTRGLPEGAVKAALPETLSPTLATLVDAPPAHGDEWLFEIKFDGYRMLARIDAGSRVRLITRNGNDWTDRLPQLAAQLEKMKLAPGWLDGEIVVPGEDGLPDFQALQNAFDQRTRLKDVVYYLFDLPYYAGHDLRAVPLTERRALLQGLLAQAPELIRFSEAFDGQAPQDMLASACRLGLEGVIGKRRDSRYAARRSADWIKLKCNQRQEFVIGGFTEPKGTRVGIGSLLLGVHGEGGELLYAGNVGTGFDTALLTELRKRLDAITTDRRPFDKPTGIDRQARWVEPKLVAEVSFGDWTQDGRIRHSVFHALRSDKPARAIVREKPMHLRESEDKAGAKRQQHSDAPGSTLPRGFKVSNAERVIDASTGVTKIELVRFYALVAPLMLEHLKGRPVSLVRAPSGIEGELFFQKHMEKAQMEGVRLLPPELDRDHEPLLEVANARGLLSAAQMNVIEFHTWNAVKTAIGKPDRMTFDLDPGQGVKWPAMQQAVELVRVFLDELGLAAFVKTSGGKGMHVVVPIKRRYDWDTVKDFSQAIVQHLARTLPQLFVAKSGPKNRVGRIFIDYLRNGFGATTVSAWSARARPGLGVSVPVAWDEVPQLKSGAHWTVQTIHTRLDRGNAPWADYADAAQNLTSAMKTLGFKP